MSPGIWADTIFGGGDGAAPIRIAVGDVERMESYSESVDPFKTALVVIDAAAAAAVLLFGLLVTEELELP